MVLRTVFVERSKNPEKRSTPRWQKDFTMFRKSVIVRDKDTGKIVAVLLKGALTKQMVNIARGFAVFKRLNARRTITGHKDKIFTSTVGHVFPIYRPPGVLSLATRQDLEFFHKCVPKLVRFLEKWYKKFAPDEWAKMTKLTQKIPEHERIGQAWHSVQVNYDYPSKYHRDGTDADNYSGVVPVGDFTGGEIVMPAWRAGFAAVEGDFVFLTQKEFHGNLPIQSGHRLSLIPFTSGGFKQYDRQLFNLPAKPAAKKPVKPATKKSRKKRVRALKKQS
jgi:hypothetical protein